MAKLTLDISTSVDGFIAGPNQTLDQPLGEGGEGLHEWALALESWRERHGLSAARPIPTPRSSTKRCTTPGPP